jgi:hypothetical protein
MDNPNPELKRLASDLLALSSRLLSLLDRANTKAAQSPSRARGGQQWAGLCLRNIAAYRTRLETAIGNRDPRAFRYAADEFTSLPRYLDDYNYSWFSRHQDLSNLMGDVRKVAAAIARSIHTFDPQSLEQARHAL